ncbi:outer membrane protein assembly factor BamB family protein [Plantactinospora endophytica]|uniref:Pyrrolo-quinoline quinone repeat domain-containing protein n=1 Tax=Plantactinospora endophytica TaxID=673535 RepID=A0ABQ4DWJ8_9ACTN|nr:PQQ-binding-like beta-propeller repeat protein [Plantactinospora endophytica]GIG86816.1 hypothetical protein Pen02_17520 [Plantactinospora endophytica]
MPTIELGELTAAFRPEPSGPPPATGPRPAARSGWLGIVLVALLGTVAAGHPFPRPWPEVTLPTRFGATVYADRNLLFVAGPERSDRGGVMLAGYRLPAVEPRWRVALPAGDLGTVQPVGDHLLLATYTDLSLPRFARLTVLDVSTGVVAWEREASLMAVSSAGLLLLWTEAPAVWADPRRPSPPDQQPGRLVAVDPATGAERWSLPVPAGALPSFDRPIRDPTGAGRVSTLVLALPGGRVEVHDLDTGALVHAGHLAEPGDGPRARVRGEAVGGLFLRYGESTVTAYGLPRLDRRWSAPLDLVVENGPFPCGVDLCSFRPQRGVRVWDPRTGATRWADDQWSTLSSLGDALIGWATGAGDADTMSVLDPATGRVLADLGAWNVFEAYGQRFVGVRYGADRRAWVVEFDPATWQHRLLTVLPGISGGCGLTATALYCRRLDASTGVWRLPG